VERRASTRELRSTVAAAVAERAVVARHGLARGDARVTEVLDVDRVGTDARDREMAAGRRHGRHLSHDGAIERARRRIRVLVKARHRTGVKREVIPNGRVRCQGHREWVHGRRLVDR
jgi:hypothetical protein